MKTNRKQIPKWQKSLAVIALNMNVLNTPIKRQKLTDRIKKKHDTTICFLPEAHFKFKDMNRLKVKGQKTDTLCK